MNYLTAGKAVLFVGGAPPISCHRRRYEVTAIVK
jgi:hypothetical protein